jgi:G3E family GTPase
MSARDESLPVTVVTGFLGAGKTTLVNAWLRPHDRGDIAVIVNEVGAVGIDGELLAARVQTLIEITGGCVCCRTQAELVTALERIAGAPQRPKRVLVETSGAASPAGVLRVLASGGRERLFRLDGVVTVVDAARIDAVLAHDLAIEQLACADVVVLSRADACSLERLERARARAQEHAGAAFITCAERGSLQDQALRPLENLLAKAREALADAEGCSRSGADSTALRAKPHESPAHAYQTVSLTLPNDLDEERFADFMETEIGRVAGRLFRTKGILSIAGLDQRLIVQGVADLVEADLGEPWGEHPRSSRLVLVGFGLDAEALARAFAACCAA